MDYDFITTCNWTATGTFTMRAYRGSNTNVVTTYSLFYRKKGTTPWTETTNGQITIDSIGEWEIANDWNRSGDDVLTHSYKEITAINRCTEVYFNPTLGNTIGNNFLSLAWSNCANLVSMPVDFNLPSGITSVGGFFLHSAWYRCTNLISMPTGFNLPSGITSVGSYFLTFAWYDCANLVSMPIGFNLPSGITSVGVYFLYGTWNNCALLNNDAYTEDLVFRFNADETFGGTCPIIPDSITGASVATPVSVAVNRDSPTPFTTTNPTTSISETTATLNGNITSIGGSAPTVRGFYLVQGVAVPTASDTVFSETGSFPTGIYSLPATGLTKNTEYSVRAFVTNTEGTGLGDTITFSTKDLAEVTTQEPTNVMITTATLNGTITDAGVPAITERGFYSMVGVSGTPTSSDTVYSESSTEAGVYAMDVTGLVKDTNYRVVAFATNTGGTSTGSVVNVKTGCVAKLPIDITPTNGTLLSTHPAVNGLNGSESKLEQYPNQDMADDPFWFTGGVAKQVSQDSLDYSVNNRNFADVSDRKYIKNLLNYSEAITGDCLRKTFEFVGLHELQDKNGVTLTDSDGKILYMEK